MVISTVGALSISYVQDLMLITKTAQGIEKKTVAPVRFVPMTGEVQRKGPGGS